MADYPGTGLATEEDEVGGWRRQRFTRVAVSCEREFGRIEEDVERQVIRPGPGGEKSVIGAMRAGGYCEGGEGVRMDGTGRTLVSEYWRPSGVENSAGGLCAKY